MKKILLLFALITVCVNLNSQFANTQTISSPNTLFKSKGGLSADSAILFLNSYPDTASANFSVASKYNSIIRVGTKYYYRTLNPDKWNEFTTAASSFFLPISDTAAMLSGYKTYYPRQSLSASTGISFDKSTGVITNTLPDQTVALTAGSGVSISGTYPNFTISNTSPSSGGTVTAVATNAGSGITGGTIFGSGTIAADTLNLSTRLWRQKGIDSINGLLVKYIPYYSATQSPNLGAYGLYSDFVQFKNPSTTTDTIGRTRWNDADKTMNIGLTNDVVLQTGQEVLILVRNQTGVAIPNGTVVRQSGVVGASGKLKVEPFLANGTHNSNQVVGVTTENIPHGSDGFVAVFGKVNGVNTSIWPDSTILYASTKVAGALTDTVPEAPNNIVKVGTVINSGTSNGILFVRIIPGSNIHQDEGVQLINPLNKSLLVYDSVSTLWKNGTLASVGGISVNDTAAMLNGYLPLTAGAGKVITGPLFGTQNWETSGDIYSSTRFKTGGNFQNDLDSTGLYNEATGYKFYAVGAGLNAWYTAQDLVANKFIKIGGDSTQYLRADGSVSNLISGTYTPIASNAQNAGTITAYEHQYSRIGNMVTVSGIVQYTTTADSVVSAVEITLPFPTTFTSTLQAIGTANCSSNFIAGYVRSDNISNKAVISFKADTSGTIIVANYIFQYQIL